MNPFYEQQAGIFRTFIVRNFSFPVIYYNIKHMGNVGKLIA